MTEHLQAHCAISPPPRFSLLLAAGHVHENPPHGLSRRAEEVRAAFPVFVRPLGDVLPSRKNTSWTSEVAWSVWPGTSWAIFLRRQPPQLVVDERE